MIVLILLSSASLAFAAGTTVYSTEALKKAVYTQMVARNGNFSISYVGSEVYSIMNNAQNFFVDVYAGNDDYLEWNRNRFYYKYAQIENRIDFSFEVTYLTTKTQEAYVDARVNSILADIILPQMNDYEKLIAVHAYICDHVSYDNTLTKYSAYNALADGEAVCQGYALLMDKMLERVGVKSIIIDGDIPEGPHAWNLVQIEGTWYHVDATNDDTNSNKFLLKTDQYMRSQSYTWDSQLFPLATKVFVVPLKVTVIVDGKLMEFDAQPYINKDNRTMVPIRFVSERLGAEVTWDSITRSVIIENRQTRLTMTIDSNTIMQDGTASSMDTTAVIRQDRTMVPLRFISEYLGATVDWDATNLTANIYSAGYAAN
jgi:hypothetical protein